MKSLRIVILLSVFINSIIGVYFYLATNRQQPINVVLTLETSTSDKLVISEESLDKLAQVISDNIIVKDQNQLIEVFQEEKAKYINLITIISVLLTVFSLYSALSAFVEKSELTRLSQEMKVKIDEYEGELQNVYFNTLISHIQKVKDSYVNDSTKYLDDGSKVNDLPSFLKAIDLDIGCLFEFIRRKKLTQRINDKSFFIEYLNLTNALIKYGFDKRYLSNDVKQMNDNEAFRFCISMLHNNVDRSIFKDFKEAVNQFTSIEWGRY